MNVGIKKFNVGDMEVKTKGIEFEVRTPDDTTQLGDLVVTKTRLIWCRGKTTPKKGVKKSWEEFIAWMET
jgi:hypothetical protein